MSHAARATRWHVAAVFGVSSRRRRQVSAVALASTAVGTCISAVIGAVACGGSTGREGLAMPETQVEAGDDATIDFDAGLFDVVITYADRVLPDISAPPEAGGEAGYPWPTCPPFIDVGPGGQPVTPGIEVDQIPSVYGPDGSIVPAPDGSACATYGFGLRARRSTSA